VANWTKKARQAAAPILDPGEDVVAGANLTSRRFAVANGGFTGGLVAGGVVGAAAGQVWDDHLERKRTEDEASRPKTTVEELPPRAIEFPDNGALGVVTNRRLILFELSAMSKPRDAFFEVTLDEIRTVYESEMDQKLSRGVPGSRHILVVFDDQTTLALYGLSSGLNRKWIDGFSSALRGAPTGF
jgi:hypothetical protein